MTEHNNTVHGPYSLWTEASRAAQPLRDAVDAADLGGAMNHQVRTAREQARTDYIIGALKAAGVTLGAWDVKVARWLGTWEPETVQTIVDWAHRAAAASARTEPSVLPDGDECCRSAATMCGECRLGIFVGDRVRVHAPLKFANDYAGTVEGIVTSLQQRLYVAVRLDHNSHLYYCTPCQLTAIPREIEGAAR